jgi:hypothetical protein
MFVIMTSTENLSLTLWEQQTNKLFEKSILRRIFAPKKDDATVGKTAV